MLLSFILLENVFLFVDWHVLKILNLQYQGRFIVVTTHNMYMSQYYSEMKGE